MLQQLGSCEDVTRMARQEGDQVELFGRQLDDLAVDGDLPTAGVDPKLRTDSADNAARRIDRFGDPGGSHLRKTDRTRAASSSGENGLTR